MRWILGLLVALCASASAWAGSDTISGTLYDFGGIKSFNQSDGTYGTIYDFGTIKQYQDNRGTTGTIYDFGDISTYQFTTPRNQIAPPTTAVPGLPNPWRAPRSFRRSWGSWDR